MIMHFLLKVQLLELKDVCFINVQLSLILEISFKYFVP